MMATIILVAGAILGVIGIGWCIMIVITNGRTGGY